MPLEQDIQASRRRRMRATKRKNEQLMGALDGLYVILCILFFGACIFAYKEFGVEALLITCVLWLPGLLLEFDDNRKFKKKTDWAQPISFEERKRRGQNVY